jgi:hypothetical protein
VRVFLGLRLEETRGEHAVSARQGLFRRICSPGIRGIGRCEPVGEVAELQRVSVSYASEALTLRRTTGETTVRTGRGRKPPKLAPFYAAIRAYVVERSDTRRVG